jgi:hypothetical protein
MNERDYATLHAIYEKHRRRYPGNPDSKQMCGMWSTTRPPDTLADTRPIAKLERAFGIEIDESEVMRLYDIDLDAALVRILELRRLQGGTDNKTREPQ